MGADLAANLNCILELDVRSKWSFNKKRFRNKDF